MNRFESDFKEDIEESFDLFLKEDKAFSDITTKSLEIKGECFVSIESRTDGIISGLSIVKMFFDYLHLDYQVFHEVEDGKNVNAGDSVFSFKADSEKVLSLERIVLNMISRCSSISTGVRKWVNLAKAYDVKLLDTRKTAPGNRYLDKYAVFFGGGLNHRFNLEDQILIKENHLFFFNNLNSAIKKIRKKDMETKIIIEIENMSQLNDVLNLDVQRVILDNWDYQNLPTAISLARKNSIEVEISGGVSLSNFESYCLLRPDFISVGSITNPTEIFDLSMLVKG